MRDNSKRMGVSRRDVIKAAGAGSAVSLTGFVGDGDEAVADVGAKQEDEVIFWSAWFDNEEMASWHDWYFEEVEAMGIDLSTTAWHYDDLHDTYLTAASTGEPDLVNGVLEQLSDYVHAGLMEPITERMEEKDNFDAFLDSALSAMEHEGEYYGIPASGNGRGLLYREDIFDEHGLEPPETAEEFHEVARTIQSEEDDIVAYNNVTKDGDVRAFQEWISHVFQHVENLYALEGDEWAVQIDADTLGQIYDDFYYQPWASDEPFTDQDLLGAGYEQHDQGYAQGRFAMIPIGTWIRGSQLDAGPDAEEIITERSNVDHLPYGEGGERGTYLEVEWVGMNSHSENQDAAWEALDLYTSTESQRRHAEAQPGDWITPVNEDVESTADVEGWETFAEIFETGRALSFVSWGTTRTAFYRTMQEVVYGQADPYDAGEELHGQLVDISSELEVPET